MLLSFASERRRFSRGLLMAVTMTSTVFNTTPGWADGNVVAGSAAISQIGGTLTVTQQTDRAIINWQSFSIGPNDVARFVQPSSTAAILNRVTGGDPSALLGTLQANGQVFLINPNGILIGPGANINVGSLVASTLELPDAMFMLGGPLHFQGDSGASVVNLGQVQAVEGDIYLMAANVVNQGVLSAANGHVGMLAGQSVTLIDGARPHLPVQANSKSLSDSTGVTNAGLIEAIQVELAANGGNAYALAINNTGTIRATGSIERNGRVYLTAPGGKIASGGAMVVKSGGRGGDVTMEGRDIRLSGASIDVSGASGGGSVRIGGGFQGQDTSLSNSTTTVADSATTIRADATGLGDGGVVVIWSDGDTHFTGEITARGGARGGNGGLAEVSGKVTLDFRGLAALNAPRGIAGTLLLDPGDFTIDATNAASITNPLIGGTNVVVSTNGSATGNGDISIDVPMFYGSSASLALLAHRHIRAGASIQNSGDGAISLIAGWNGVLGAPGGSGIQSPASFNFADFVANPASYGNHGGSIFINGSAGSLGVAVGSRFGNTTSVAGYDVEVAGSDVTDGAFAQLGFRGQSEWLDINSPINVYAQNSVHVRGGRGSHTYAQIGHGGMDARGNLNGNITLNSGDVLVHGGDSIGSYAQIGHGGTNVVGDLNGDITGNSVGDIHILGGGLVSGGQRSYAQLGHGGDNASANWNDPGTISGDIHFDRTGSIDVHGGGATNAFAQFGHGGSSARHAIHGNISIDHVDGDLQVLGGSALDAYAQFGHGGAFSDHMGIDGRGRIVGTISLGQVGNVTVDGGSQLRSYAQFGHGGYRSLGDIASNDEDSAITIGVYPSVHSAAAPTGGVNHLSIRGGSGDFAYAQFGHGGALAEAGFDTQHGHILIADVADLLVQGGSSNGAYSQLGHGGLFSEGSKSGDIIVLNATGSPGNVTVRGGAPTGFSGDSPYAQLGHGGERAMSNGGSITGSIVVVNAGDVVVEGGGSAGSEVTSRGTAGYGLLGHGGRGLDPFGGVTIGGEPGPGSRVQLFDDSGANSAVIVQARNVLVRGNGWGGDAQIGAGGSDGAYSTDLAVYIEANPSAFPNVSGPGGDVILEGHNGGIGHIGNGGLGNRSLGNLRGNIYVLAHRDVRLAALDNGPLGDGFVPLNQESAFGEFDGYLSSPARVQIGTIGRFGQENGQPVGRVIVAVDQANPLADGGGGLSMTDHTFIDMGGPQTKNQVRIFDSRRGPFPVGNLADGSIINGVAFDSSLPPGTLGSWNQNIEFQSWAHEQWGPTGTSFTLADFFSGELPYAAPFTFYFLGRDPLPIPSEPEFTPFFPVYDLIAHLPYPPAGIGAGTARYGAAEPRDGEIAGGSSYDVFGQ